MKTAIKRPLLHYAVIAGYALAPVFNIILYARVFNLTISALVQNFFTVFGGMSGTLLLVEPLVGLSLFFIHRLSWYIFVTHSALLVADNIRKLISTGGWYQLSVLAGTALWVAVIAYVLQKDFRAPYFQALPRSWREKRRVPIHHYIWFAGEQKEIADFSESGCFVAGPSLELKLGERVPVRLSLEKKDIDFSCDGEVVRITNAGLGIRFVDVALSDRRRLRRFFKNKFPLRYAVQIDCIWQGSSVMALAVKTVDISRDGCFFATDIRKFKPGPRGTLMLRIGEDDFMLECDVIWINDGTFIKPLGAGVQFTTPQRRLMRKLHATYPDLPLTR